MYYRHIGTGARTSIQNIGTALQNYGDKTRFAPAAINAKIVIYNTCFGSKYHRE